MKNKKGFTLIELLVAVVIMISILSIAIVSVSNLSKKQKENAYGRVKDQILTAANDYFSSNEYLFEKEESIPGSTTVITGYITLKSLVEQGYLNVLTNPKDGTKLNECNYVKLTKSNNIVSTEYVEDPSGCSKNNQITYSNIVKDCPSVNLSFSLTGTPGNGNWYKSNVTEHVEASTEDGRALTVTRNGNSINSNYTKSFNSDVNISDVTILAKNDCGNSNRIIKTYGIDKTEPVITPLKLKEGSKEANTIVQAEYLDSAWTNKDIYNMFKISDNLKLASAKRILSGAVSSSTSINVSSNSIDTASWIASGNGKIKLKIEAADEAGNNANVEYTINRDTVKPTITYKDVSGNYSLSGTPTTWNKEKVDFSVSATDSHSGINTSSNQINNALFYVEWDTATGSDSHYINSDGTKQAGGSATEVGATITKNNGTYTRTNAGLSSEGRRWETYKVCDIAGNCAEKTIYVNIDKTKPTLAFNIKQNASTSSNTGWSNKNASFDITVRDELSGINKTNNATGYNGKMVKQEWNSAGSKTFGSFTNASSIGEGGSYTINKTSDGKGYTILNEYFSDEGARMGRYTVCDIAGNCNNSTIYTKIDKTPPYTPSPNESILQSTYSGYQNNGYKYYQGVWCTLTKTNISDFNTFKTAGDSWIPNLTTTNSSTSCVNGGNCFGPEFTTSNYSNYRYNTENNVYCTVKKKGNSGVVAQPTPLYVEDNLSTVKRYVKWYHNATGPAQVKDWIEYTSDVNLSYSAPEGKQKATYVIYMIKLKDEAGNESKTFRLDIAPCYIIDNNNTTKCAKGGTSTQAQNWDTSLERLN